MATQADLSKLIYANSKTPYVDQYNNYKASQETSRKNYLSSQASARTAYLNNLASDRTKYRTEQAGIANAYKKQMATDNENAIAKSNANYDASARQNYINYMQAQKNLPSQLNALGIRGGASESSAIRLGTGYGQNVASNEAARNADIDSLRQTYAQQLAAYEKEYRDLLASYDQNYNNLVSTYNQNYDDRISTYNQNYTDKLASAYATAMENQYKWEQQQKEKDLEYFSNSIEGRFGSVESYDQLIAALKKSSDPNRAYKIALAQKARNTLKDKLAEKNSSSGGGGGGGSSSRRSYGGSSGGASGGSSGNTSYSNAQAINAKYKNRAASGSNAYQRSSASRSSSRSSIANRVASRLSWFTRG